MLFCFFRFWKCLLFNSVIVWYEIIHELKLFQTEEGGFEKTSMTLEVGRDVVSCAVGDFNGDALPDVLVIQKS